MQLKKILIKEVNFGFIIFIKLSNMIQSALHWAYLN